MVKDFHTPITLSAVLGVGHSVGVTESAETSKGRRVHGLAIYELLLLFGLTTLLDDRVRRVDTRQNYS